MVAETEAQKKAREHEEELRKAVEKLREEANKFNPGKVEVKLKEPPKKGECPCCGTPPPRIGVLLGPPWRHQLATARAHLAEMRKIEADKVPEDDVLLEVLKMHGGMIVECQGKDSDDKPCDCSYLVRVNDWPGVKVTPSE